MENKNFRVLKLSKLMRFRALKSSKVESFRALKFYHPKTLKKESFKTLKTHDGIYIQMTQNVIMYSNMGLIIFLNQ